MGIVNVIGVFIAREADCVMYTWAGPEIAVATTKAYSCQLIALDLLAMKFAYARGAISSSELQGYIEDMKCLPEQVELLLKNKKPYSKICQSLFGSKRCLFLSVVVLIMQFLLKDLSKLKRNRQFIWRRMQPES